MLDYSAARLFECSTVRLFEYSNTRILEREKKENMIVCPNCKADIDNDSIYCDQCGQALTFCTKCGRVGLGKRCSYCGAQMARPQLSPYDGSGNPVTFTTTAVANDLTHNSKMPSITLGNVALGINIVGVDDAIIGRREGPYIALFQGYRYVSGRHAQLHFDKEQGWTIIDKNSSNGTFVNGSKLAPENPIALATDDTLTLANINLKVKIG